MKLTDLYLNDEEIKNKIGLWERTDLATNELKEFGWCKLVSKASANHAVKKVAEDMQRFAKAYDMRIDGFVIPWEYWQALKKLVEELDK